MAFRGYLKTEVNPASPIDGWLWVDSTVNQRGAVIHHQTHGSIRYRRIVGASLPLYCHHNAAPEPVTDDHIQTAVFDDSEFTYRLGDGGSKSFTSSTGIFTADQDMDQGSAWIIYYNARATGVPVGHISYITFEFFKRDTGNSDTSLFIKTVHNLPGLFPTNGENTSVTPAGSVTTADRLRMTVTMGTLPI